MNEGYMALTICILRNVTPEVAFKMLQGKHYINRKWTAYDVEEIEIMRSNGMTWREIGNAYGVEAQVAYKRYYYYKKKIESSH